MKFKITYTAKEEILVEVNSLEEAEEYAEKVLDGDLYNNLPRLADPCYVNTSIKQLSDEEASKYDKDDFKSTDDY